MKITSFKYYWPEKPKLIHPKQNLVDVLDESSNWVAEKKYNGNRLQLHYIDGKFKFYNRHGEEFTSRYFTPSNELLEQLDNLKEKLGSGYWLFDGELRHNKVVGVRQKIVLYDIFIKDGELISYMKFKERRKILESLIDNSNEILTIPKQFTNDFKNLFKEVIKDNEIEGLVFKNLYGKLSINTSSSKDSMWMRKVRREHENYMF